MTLGTLLKMLPCELHLKSDLDARNTSVPAPNAGQTSVAICITVCAKAFDLLVHIVWQFLGSQDVIGD